MKVHFGWFTAEKQEAQRWYNFLGSYIKKKCDILVSDVSKYKPFGTEVSLDLF